MGSKSARHSAMVINRTNICGGVKKAGIAPRATNFYGQAFQMRRAAHQVSKTMKRCGFGKVMRPTQNYRKMAYL